MIVVARPGRFSTAFWSAVGPVGCLSRLNRVSCVVLCDVTLPKHPGLRLSAPVTRCQLRRAQFDLLRLSDGPQAHSEVPEARMQHYGKV
jgi:hypothetical protein